MRFFTLDEFRCRHCGIVQMNTGTLLLLDELRERCGFALPVSSGYRCPAHNAAVSTTGADGPHTTGHAVDLLVSGERTYPVLRHALELGFTGVGLFQRLDHARRFVHLDDLDAGEGRPRPTVWTY